MQFGRTSERISRQIEQLKLRLEELESGAAEDATKAESEAADPAAPIREGPTEAQAAARSSATPGGGASARR